MGNNSVPKFIFLLSRFPVYRGSVLGRFYCIAKKIQRYTIFFITVNALHVSARHIPDAVCTVFELLMMGGETA